MMDFLRFLSPEARKRVEAEREHHRKDVAEARALSNAELCAQMKRYLAQCEFPYRWTPGQPVYDGVVAHVLIPEMIRRLGGE